MSFLKLNPPVISLIVGMIAALCLPDAGITNHLINFTPWNAPIFLAAIGVLYIRIKREHIFLNTYLWAFGYFVVGLSWIGNALLIDSNPYAWAWPLAVVGLPIILSLFLAIILGVAARVIHRITPLTFAALFTIAEYARAHLFTGFPWNMPGMFWSDTLVIFQSLSIIGILGLTFITVWMSAHLADRIVIKNKNPIGDVALIVVSCTLLYSGISALNTPPPRDTTEQQIVMVQANIPQSERFDPDLMVDHFYKHIGYSERPADLKNQPTLIIWPETILPPSYINAPAVRRAMIDLIATYPAGSALMTGGLRIDGPQNAPEYYNSLIAFGARGTATPLYDKRHLVPFGEYIPYQKYIPLTPVARFENLTAGSSDTTVTVPGHAPFRPMICYESIFGSELRTTINDASWILIVTNDAWYGNSPGPYQHWAEGRARAIETGRWAVRVAVTGISSVFDDRGRVVATLPYGTAGAAIATLNLPVDPTTTIYGRYGDKPLLLLLIGILVIALFIPFKKKT